MKWFDLGLVYGKKRLPVFEKKFGVVLTNMEKEEFAGYKIIIDAAYDYTQLDPPNYMVGVVGHALSVKK